MNIEELAKQINEAIAKIKEQLKGAVTADVLDGALKGIRDQLKTLEDAPEDSGEAFKTLADEVKTLTTEIETLNKEVTARMTPSNGVTFEGEFLKWLQSNEAELKAIKANQSGSIEFKAPAAIGSSNITVPDGVPATFGAQVTGTSNVNLRGVFIDSLVNFFTTSLAAFPYSESLPKEGDFEAVAECAVKPLIDFKVETRWAEPIKVAAHEIFCEEVTVDIPNMLDVGINFLKAKHDLKRQNLILFGTGTPPEPTGATVYGRLFTAGTMANAFVAPNIMHVINACITDIFTTHNFTDEMAYMPNLVLMNPIDFFVQFVGAVTTDGLPLYPQAALFNEVRFGSVLIKPERSIPAGEIFVGDMAKYNVSRYQPYSLRVGWINDQFIRNQFTMVGESRMHAYVKKLDELAFIYDTIDTIKTALTAI